MREEIKETDKKECPYCSSKNIQYQVSFAIEPNYGSHTFPEPEPYYKCLDCGKEFIYKGKEA